MMSFPQLDPGIPVLALIVKSAGGDILGFQQPLLRSEWVVITESRIAQSRLQTAD